MEENIVHVEDNEFLHALKDQTDSTSTLKAMSYTLNN